MIFLPNKVSEQLTEKTQIILDLFLFMVFISLGILLMMFIESHEILLTQTLGENGFNFIYEGTGSILAFTTLLLTFFFITPLALTLILRVILAFPAGRTYAKKYLGVGSKTPTASPSAKPHKED